MTPLPASDALDAIRRIPRLAHRLPAATARYWSTMERHNLYIGEYGDDLPEVKDWRWTPWMPLTD